MNWKTVRHLISVERKSGRLLRGKKTTNYNVRRNRIFSYLGYILAIAIGIAAGAIVIFAYGQIVTTAELAILFKEAFANFQFSLPTLILIFTFVFSMMQQIQRSGVSASRQSPYWLPITWQEHTLASIIADVSGLPLYAIAIFSPAVLITSVITGQVAIAVGAVLAMLGAAFMASATTEIFRILQVRFTGAVYKSTGRAAVWVRFISSIGFFVVFYIIYFSLITGSNAINFIQTVASVQSAIWFVPFVWLGMTLYSLVNGLLLQGIAFLAASVLFIYGLFYLGTVLNKRFGLYEPPTIKISQGTYVPKTGLLGKMGFSSAEAALLRKDIRAFTRRRELISAFIIPIVFLILPIMNSVNGVGSEVGFLSLFWIALITVFPVVLMASSVGSFMTGEEGQNIWRIYVSPISAKTYVKSKYTFILVFSLIVLPVTGTIGFIVYQPTLQAMLTLVAEAVIIAFAVSALSLGNGIKGADFTEIPRPRMIRGEWSLINMLTCGGVALAIMAPLIPRMLNIMGLPIPPILEVYQAVIISAVIGAIMTVVFHRIAVDNAKELITKAEV
ncbi:MAG: hypothetical protein NWF04_03375 [Candidatus Bathyarchaeota archaeon]|nr:hypothetical protein [Candidatus Bathyarchaeota archaeon]